MSTPTRSGRCRVLRAAARLALPALVAGFATPLADRPAAQSPPADLLVPPAFHLSTGDPFVTGDANADGHVDIIYHRFFPAPKSLAVVLGDGLGGFGPAIPTSIAPVVPRLLRGGDLDHDGDTDLAYIVDGTATMQVRLSLGDGSFSEPVTLPMAHAGVAFRLLVCDATGDGHLDLVASQEGTNRFTLYVGVGDGTFASPPSEIIAYAGAGLAASGDLDGDGNLDLACIGGLFVGGEHNVLFGTGGGAFGPPQPAGCNFGQPPLAVADLTGDGRDDFAPVNASGHAVLSWSGSGLVTKPIDLPYPSPEQTTAATGDLDRDGLAELLLADTNGRLVVVRPSGDEFEVSAEFGVERFPKDLHVVDIDEDGGMDVLSLREMVSVRSGQGDGSLQPMYMLAGTAADMAVGDVTGDGFSDVVCVLGAGHPAQLLRGQLGGGLSPAPPLDLGPEPDQVWLLDATGDGQLDLLTSGGSTIAVAAGRGDGSFGPPLLSPVAGDIEHAEVAPFGGDALPDLAVLLDDVGVGQPSFVHVLVNSGGSFVAVESTSVSPPGGTASTFAAADVDGDLDTDLIVSWGGGYLRVFIRQPLGYEPGFLVEQTVLGPISAADLDRDGDVDIALEAPPGVVIRSGDGAGDFSAVSTVTIPALQRFELADLDADGWLDIVGSRWNLNSELAVVLARPGGGFGTYGSWGVGAFALFTRSADINRDGKPDVVVALDQSRLAVVENGTGPWSKLGHSLGGAEGFSRLQGFGPLTPGSPVTVRISNGQAGSPAILVAGLSQILAPFKGGVLVPQPTLVVPLGVLDEAGARQVSGLWPTTMPHDASYSLQVWRPEAGAPSGFGATTAIEGMTP